MAKCEETAGFLIAAPCRAKATEKCHACGKHVCPTHSRDAAVRAGKCCITCHRKFGAKYEEQTDDPYLYSGFYYSNYYSTYSYGDQDWSEGRAAFDNDSADTEDQDWENDFDGS